MVNEKTGFVNAFWSTADIYKNIAIVVLPSPTEILASAETSFPFARTSFGFIFGNSTIPFPFEVTVTLQ